MWARFAVIVTFAGFNLIFSRNLSLANSACRGAITPSRWNVLPLFYLGWPLFWGLHAGPNRWSA
jgi:hypothetical protein